MSPWTRQAGISLTALAATGLLLAGCGGDSTDETSGTGSGTTASTPPSASTPSGSTDSGSGTTVTVTEKEFGIELSEKTFAAGAYTFKVTNQGKFPHNLVVKGPGVDSQASPTLQGGQSGDLSVTLQAGSYELWCSIDGHKAKGMDMTITVA